MYALSLVTLITLCNITPNRNENLLEGAER